MLQIHAAKWEIGWLAHWATTLLTVNESYSLFREVVAASCLPGQWWKFAFSVRHAMNSDGRTSRYHTLNPTSSRDPLFTVVSSACTQLEIWASASGRIGKACEKCVEKLPAPLANRFAGLGSGRGPGEECSIFVVLRKVALHKIACNKNYTFSDHLLAHLFVFALAYLVLFRFSSC